MSKVIEQLQEDLQNVLIEVSEFNVNKKTKTRSKKIRTMLGELKKQITDIRKELMELDKAGY